jgi:hypothetical protein
LFPRISVIFTPSDTLDGSSNASAIEKDLPLNKGLSELMNLAFFVSLSLSLLMLFDSGTALFYTKIEG